MILENDRLKHKTDLIKNRSALIAVTNIVMTLSNLTDCYQRAVKFHFSDSAVFTIRENVAFHVYRGEHFR